MAHQPRARQVAQQVDKACAIGSSVHRISRSTFVASAGSRVTSSSPSGCMSVFIGVLQFVGPTAGASAARGLLCIGCMGWLDPSQSPLRRHSVGDLRLAVSGRSASNESRQSAGAQNTAASRSPLRLAFGHAAAEAVASDGQDWALPHARTRETSAESSQLARARDPQSYRPACRAPHSSHA
jgi:hypothetical protein